MIQSQIYQVDLYHVPLSAIYTNVHTELDFIEANYETFTTGGCSILRPCVSLTRILSNLIENTSFFVSVS